MTNTRNIIGKTLISCGVGAISRKLLAYCIECRDIVCNWFVCSQLFNCSLIKEKTRSNCALNNILSINRRRKNITICEYNNNNNCKMRQEKGRRRTVIWISVNENVSIYSDIENRRNQNWNGTNETMGRHLWGPFKFEL